MLIDRRENVMRSLSLHYHKLFENSLQDLLKFFGGNFPTISSGFGQYLSHG